MITSNRKLKTSLLFFSFSLSYLSRFFLCFPCLSDFHVIQNNSLKSLSPSHLLFFFHLGWGTGSELAKFQRTVENKEKWRKEAVKSSVAPQRPLKGGGAGAVHRAGPSGYSQASIIGQSSYKLHQSFTSPPRSNHKYVQSRLC